MSLERHINFTKATLLDLPLPAVGQRAIYHDTKVLGLQLRVTASGTKTFSVLARVKGGEPGRNTVGKFPAITVDQARQVALNILSDLAQGIDVAARQRKERATLTFQALFQNYMERHSKPKKRTWAEDECKYRQYLADPLGRKRLSAITRRDVADIHAKITAEGHPATANRVIALISSVFGWAISVDLWESNPVTGVRRNPEQSRDRFIRSNELPLFFDALYAETNETVRDYFLLSLLTGARRSNVLEMQWADIALEDACWHIARTKNGDSQTVSLVPEAVEVLRRRRATSKSSFVFPGSGATGHLIEPKKGWYRILWRMTGLALLGQLKERLTWTEKATEILAKEFLERADVEDALKELRDRANEVGIDPSSVQIPNLRIHDLRRTLASWQVMTGATLSVIGKSLNHRSTATTAVYARMDLNPVRTAVTRATDEMLRLGKGKRHLPKTLADV